MKKNKTSLEIIIPLGVVLCGCASWHYAFTNADVITGGSGSRQR
jgi:hypothetical protein